MRVKKLEIAKAAKAVHNLALPASSGTTLAFGCADTDGNVCVRFVVRGEKVIPAQEALVLQRRLAGDTLARIGRDYLGVCREGVRLRESRGWHRLANAMQTCFYRDNTTLEVEAETCSSK